MNQIVYGDCRKSMLELYDAGTTVQTIITSPPYWGLRDYGKEGQIGQEKTPEGFVANMLQVFKLARDILADDGTLWLNLGDTYKNKRLMGIPWRVALALQDDGWYLRSDIVWHKKNPMPSSALDRPTPAHEFVFLLTKNPKYYYDWEAIAEEVKPDTIARGYRGRNEGHKYEDGASGQNRQGLHKPRKKRDKSEPPVPGKANKRDVWEISTKGFSGAHFAVFPPELVEPCVLAGSRVGDIVLDPFFGSGTTGEVAQRLGRKYIGLELNEEYKPLQERRLAQQAFEL